MGLLAKFFAVKGGGKVAAAANRVQAKVIDIDPQGQSVALLTEGVIDGHPFQAMQTFEKGNGPKLIWPVSAEPIESSATLKRSIVRQLFTNQN